MSVVALNGWRPADVAFDGSFFLSIIDRLEKARVEIEERFVAGGAAAVSAHQEVRQLTEAFDRISRSLDEATVHRAIGNLSDAISELRRRIDTERERQAELGAVLQNATTIRADIAKIEAILGHLRSCAIATRITGAGNDKFIAFGHEISAYVHKAEQEVARFSERVDEINSNLHSVAEEGKESLELMADAVPKASEKVMEAAAAIDRRLVELRRLAARAAPLLRAVEVKFATILTALQIGDVTRQRIEHVQTGIRELLALMGQGTDIPELRIPALRLFDALTAALSSEFESSTRQVVDALQGLGGDARNILALHHHSGSAASSESAPMAVAKDSLGTMRLIVGDVERASSQSANADETIRRLAAELLDNAGNIGNLRNVRKDIRLLALNAHLHCSRMGELGRSVSVIAAEINVSGDRLGGSAEAILRCLAEIRNRDGLLNRREGGRDLIADLDDVAAALNMSDSECKENLDLFSSQGEAIVARIVAVAHDLDFSLQLGEQLAACSSALAKAAAGSGPAGEAPAELQGFVSNIFSIYTMKSEREIHYTLFPDTNVASFDRNNDRVNKINNDIDEVDDCFL